MSEAYKELLVRNKVRASGIAVRVLFIAVISVLVVVGLVYSWLWMIAVIVGIGAYFAFIYTAVEFEYLILGREISVDKIFGQTKRKRAETFDIDKLEILAPATSHELDSYRNRPSRKTDYSAGHDLDDLKLYVMYYEGRRVLLNLDEEAVKMIKSMAPRKVFDY